MLWLEIERWRRVSSHCVSPTPPRKENPCLPKTSAVPKICRRIRRGMCSPCLEVGKRVCNTVHSLPVGTITTRRGRGLSRVSVQGRGQPSRMTSGASTRRRKTRIRTSTSTASATTTTPMTTTMTPLLLPTKTKQPSQQRQQRQTDDDEGHWNGRKAPRMSLRVCHQVYPAPTPRKGLLPQQLHPDCSVCSVQPNRISVGQMLHCSCHLFCSSSRCNCKRSTVESTPSERRELISSPCLSESRLRRKRLWSLDASLQWAQKKEF